MTRIKISLGILLLLIAVSIFSGQWINKSCRNLMNISSHAEEIFSQGDIQQTLEITRQLEKEWEHFSSKAKIFIRSNKLSDIDRLCARINNLAENQSEELTAELKEFSHLVNLLRNVEVFS
ncbi:MAG: DUF4363 family protein [Ruminococcus sp.]|nr:DUF4363 family protein [Ruminococcus sp.]MDE7225392.1 DUF4363 family protein [Ruminococcus sp.]